MKYFEAALICCIVDIVSMQLYGRLADPPFSSGQCDEILLSSVIQCVAMGRASKEGMVYFNLKNKLCRLHCTFVYNINSRTDEDWYHFARSSTLTAASANTPTSSSVNENNPSNWGAHFATDGMMPMSSVNIFATDYEHTPWVMVTLDKPSTIELVRVFNRRDAHGERFHDVAFEVSSDAVIFEQKGYFKGPGITSQVIEILFDSPTVGQNVRIRITQGTNNILNIVEIEIYCFD